MTKRLSLAIGFPLATVLIFFFELNWALDLGHVVPAVLIMLMVSACIFVLAPRAKRIKRVWLSHILVWLTAICLAAIAIPFWWQQASPWAFPLLFFSIHVPVIHLISTGSWLDR